MNTIILYFVISHLVLLTQLSKPYDFNLKLANCYLWPLFIITRLHTYLASKLVVVIDFLSVFSDYFRNACIYIHFRYMITKDKILNNFRK